MKKTSVLIILFFFSKEIKSQTDLSYDTIRRHEVSVSVLPVITILGGASDLSGNSNFNFGYKYYTKNRFVIRASFLYFIQKYRQDYYSGIAFYDRTVGNKNVFRVNQAGGSNKLQLGLGLEKIYKVNRLTHGFGGEIGVNHQDRNYGENFFFRPDSVTNNNFYIAGNTNDYQVDSLGYFANEKAIGISLHAFYSIRYKISKHWYVSATVGPSINLSMVNGTRYDRPSKQSNNFRNFDVNIPNVPLISDISICFRW